MHIRHPFPRLIPFAISLCLLAALLLSSCSPSNTTTSLTTPTATSAGTVISQPTSASTAIISVTPTIVSGLQPVTTPLAAPPQECVTKPPPSMRHLESLGGNSNVTLVGGGPFWIYGMYYPGKVLHMAAFGNSQWPMTKIVVEVGPNYNQPVILRLRQEETGALAWWTDAQAPPRAATQTLILDPETDTEDVGPIPGVPDVPHGSPDPGWSEWGVFPLFQVAGCYTLEVSWSGGSWQSSFAVGS